MWVNGGWKKQDETPMRAWDQGGVGLDDSVRCELCCGVAWALLLTPSSPPSDSQSAPPKSPSFVVAKEMHGGCGARSSLGSENKDHRFHCQGRYMRDPAKSAGAQPCGLKALHLTIISVPRGSFLVSDLGATVRPMPFPQHSLVHLSNQPLPYIHCEG